jgi:hypothetical protein
VNVSGDFFIGYSVSSSDSFEVYHVKNRGVNGPSTAYVDNGTWQTIDAITSPAINTSLAIGLTECYGKIQSPKPQSIRIGPNPCTDNMLNIYPANGITLTGVSCLDLSGKSLPISYNLSLGSAFITFNLLPGMYFLKVSTLGESVSIPFIVLSK